MTWTLNVSGHVEEADAEAKNQRASALIDAVQAAVDGLPEKPSTASFNWSDGEDQRNIDLLHREA